MIVKLACGTVFHSVCQVWLSSGPPEYFTFSYCAWLWNCVHCLLPHPSQSFDQKMSGEKKHVIGFNQCFQKLGVGIGSRIYCFCVSAAFSTKYHAILKPYIQLRQRKYPVQEELEKTLGYNKKYRYLYCKEMYTELCFKTRIFKKISTPVDEIFSPFLMSTMSSYLGCCCYFL